jgi:hypothetical protein
MPVLSQGKASARPWLNKDWNRISNAAAVCIEEELCDMVVSCGRQKMDD